MKYGIRASSGGGRSSARETIGRVAAGAIAEKWLREAFGVEIVAFVSSVGDISLGGDVGCFWKLHMPSTIADRFSGSRGERENAHARTR